MSESVSKTLKIFFRHLLCRDPATVFANTIKLLTSFVFLQQSEILYFENKLDKEFLELKQQYVSQRKRYRNLADYLCCLLIFPAELSLPYFPSRHESTHVFVMFCILIFFGLVLFILKF